MTTFTQDFAAVLDRTFDWSTRIASMAGTPALSSATVTCATTGVSVASVTVVSPTVTFRLSATGLTAPVIAPVVCHVVFADGQEDEWTMNVQFTNT